MSVLRRKRSANCWMTQQFSTRPHRTGRSSSSNALALHSGGVRLESRPWHCLLWLRFSWFSLIPPGKFWDSTSIRLRPNRSIYLPVYDSPYHSTLYRVSQEERPIFLEVIVLFHCTVPKSLLRKRYYVLLAVPVFIVQVTKLVQFTKYNIVMCPGFRD
jgi:hypothetical protein